MRFTTKTFKMDDDDLDELLKLREMRNSRIKDSKKQNESNRASDTINEDDGESERVASVMGFKNFGKKARTFDFDALFEQTRRAAKLQYEERSKAADEINSNSDSTAKQNFVRKSLNNESSSSSSSSQSSDSEDEDEMVGPPIPDNLKSSGNSSNNSTDSEEEVSVTERYKTIPASHEVSLEHSNKTVSAISLDPSGARLITGGYDYEVKFWDFAGMDASLQSFRSLKPCESHLIKNLEYGITGDTILIIAGNSQAKVLDRDGFEIYECAKGDQYITDMARTKGHCAMLNDGCWHPRNKEEFLTCSCDGSLRIWIMDEKAKQQNVIKPRQQGGLRAIPTSCRYDKNGKLVAAACQDGSIQMWDHRKHFVNTALLARNAHEKGCDISSIAFSYDNNYLSSRGCDSTLKLWDLRKFKQPVHVALDLFNRYSQTDCNFSPDDSYVFTGLSLDKNDKIGKLLFLYRDTFKIAYELEVGD